MILLLLLLSIRYFGVAYIIVCDDVCRYLVMIVVVFFYLQRFEAAAEEVKTLTKRPTDVELLELYALYKQATVGDNDTS